MGHGDVDEVREGLHPGAGPDPVVVQEVDAAHLGVDDETPEAAVAHQDVGASAQEEVGHLPGAGEEDHLGQLVGGPSPDQVVGGTPDAEGGHGRQGDVALHAPGPQKVLEAVKEVGLAGHPWKNSSVIQGRYPPGRWL